MSPQYYTYLVRGVSHGDPDLAVRREAKREKMLTAYEKPILHVPYVMGRGGDECLLPDSASEIRCQRDEW